MGQVEPKSHQSAANSTIGGWETFSVTIKTDFSCLPIPLGEKSKSAEAENASYRGPVRRMIASVTQELSSMVAVSVCFLKKTQKQNHNHIGCNSIKNPKTLVLKKSGLTSWVTGRSSCLCPPLNYMLVLPCCSDKIKWKRISSIFLSPVC